MGRCESGGVRPYTFESYRLAYLEIYAVAALSKNHESVRKMAIEAILHMEKVRRQKKSYRRCIW